MNPVQTLALLSVSEHPLLNSRQSQENNFLVQNAILADFFLAGFGSFVFKLILNIA